MNIAADVGEGAGEDGAILDQVDSASVACGVHAGSPAVSVATALECIRRGIEVGAHPGYDDREGFGRTDQPLTPAEIERLVATQVEALAAVVPLAYLKPHGALYHRCQRDPEAADALARVGRRYGIGLVGQPGFEILSAAARAGLPGYREGYVDRGLLPDGRLVPRDRPGALLRPDKAAEQAVRLTGTNRFDTLCLHGDSPGAAAVAFAVRRALREAGVHTGPLVAR